MSYDDYQDDNVEEMIIRDGDNAILWARGVLADPDALILDTETTGLDGASEICRIAIVNMAGECVYESLVKPWCKIPRETINIHHITNEMVKDAPGFKDVHADICKAIEGKTVITYNAEFDSRMIYQSGKYYGGLPAIGANYQCAMLKYAEWYGEYSTYRGSYKWQRLTGGDHTAKGDCLATLELIKKMAKARLSTEKEGENA